MSRVRVIKNDYTMDIAAGDVNNLSVVNKFGRNTAVGDGNTEEIWDGNAAYVFPTTAVITDVSQTSDQVAMRGATIEVQGLDANWDLTVQNVTLNASNTTTAVKLGTALIRVFRMKVLANVVGDSTIRAHNAAENQDYAVIGTGNNQTLMAIYTIPNGKTGYLTNYYATANPGVGSPTTLDMKLWATDNDNGYAKQLKHSLGLNAATQAYGRFQHFFNPYYKLNQKTDVYVTGTAAGAAVDVSAGFDIILKDN